MDSLQSGDLRRILRKLSENRDHADLLALLTEQIPASDLNTLLLKLFHEKVKQSSPGDLLNRYHSNRFVRPAEVDILKLKQLEMDVLTAAKSHGVLPIQLSPVAPLGCASIVGPVDQNKVISALRGTEVVSDATNLMAMHIADLIKYQKISREKHLRFCTTHRHVRAQFFGEDPGMLAHFHLFCMVSAGVDQGSYRFEMPALWEQIDVYRTVFKSIFRSDIEVIFSERGGYKDSSGFVSRIIDYGSKLQRNNVTISKGPPNNENRYYEGLQFTIKTAINGKDYYIGDGGFVNWTQKMTGNRKERLLISAIGLDRLLL